MILSEAKRVRQERQLTWKQTSGETEIHGGPDVSKTKSARKD